MAKKIVKTCVFLILLIIVLAKINDIFKFKYSDGIYSLKTFYELLENTVDVLVLGSRHAFEDINPAILYEKYGIAAFDLGGSVQSLWNTFYYLKEALKSQKPQLIVLEAYGTVVDMEYSDSSPAIKNTYGMRWSRDKAEASAGYAVVRGIAPVASGKKGDILAFAKEDPVNGHIIQIALAQVDGKKVLPDTWYGTDLTERQGALI